MTAAINAYLTLGKLPHVFEIVTILAQRRFYRVKATGGFGSMIDNVAL
jgi:hypothetical protein